MIVKRMCKLDTTNFKLRDEISFTLSIGECHEAIAVKEEDDGMIFIFRDCLRDRYYMNAIASNAGGYSESNLRDILRVVIRDTFPDDIRALMLPVYEKDLVRIPSEKELFGFNSISDNEDVSVTQFETMKNMKNRQAFIRDNFDCYWLMNTVLDSFLTCNSSGNPSYSYASNLCGIRPVFKLKNEV